MKKKAGRRDSGKNVPENYRAVIIALVVGMVVSVGLLSLCALLLSSKDMPDGAVALLSVISMTIGCMTAGFIAGSIIRSSGLLYGFICGLSMYFLAFMIQLIAVGGTISALALYKLIAFIVSSMIGSVIGVNRRRKFI